MTSNPLQRVSRGCAARCRAEGGAGRAEAPAGRSAGLFSPVVVSAVAVVVMLAASIVVLVMVMRPISTMIVVMRVTRGVFPLVPIMAHEVDGSAARVVLGAMLAPVFLVPRRNVQVKRLRRHRRRRRLDQDRLGVDHLRSGLTSDVDLTIQSGLIDPDRDADVAREGRGDRCKCDGGKQISFHIGEFLVDGHAIPRLAAGYAKAFCQTVNFVSECGWRRGKSCRCRQPKTLCG